MSNPTELPDLEAVAEMLESQHTWLTNVSAANLVREMARRYHLEIEGPKAEQPTQIIEVFNLYAAVNAMMAHLGMHGEIETSHKTVDNVMSALLALDGGARCAADGRFS